MKILNKYFELIFVGAITAILYFLTYTYQLGYFSYYNIPSIFIEISPSIIVDKLAWFFLIAIFSITTLRGIFIFIGENRSEQVQDEIKGVLLLLSMSYYFWVINPIFCYISIAFLILVGIDIIRISLDKLRKKEFKNFISYNKINMFYIGMSLELHDILRYLFITVLMASIAYSIGIYKAANDPEKTEIAINNRKAIVVSEYKSKLIIKYKKDKYDKLEDGFSIVDINGDYKIISKK
ncbi:hypothetical protein [Clostridium botulinum]|nr:hypothetical protein [Clostridium botulinum]ACO86711.1 phage protein [Clostridium botulinum A2 str. Kyoto]AUN07501.1 hypothetical protein RSJ14_12695 [Clostridium botulinum]MBN3364217.1 hypothetical protein [Clostridium botulinum]MBN3368391.1 hypothetical protein [Clostridium botulinum]MBN3376636.1 hypothetical protein [Clostridium botulinum]